MKIRILSREPPKTSGPENYETKSVGELLRLIYLRKEVKLRMNSLCKKVKRIIAACMAVVMALGAMQMNTKSAKAATTGTAGVSSLGNYGSINIGTKVKGSTWWKLSVDGSPAFCLDLGYTCHAGNSYEVKTNYSWDQTTGGAKQGYYAKIVRWYVNDCN
nr:hypothetical protein [Lachnospiraceae bacterium]